MRFFLNYFYFLEILSLQSSCSWILLPLDSGLAVYAYILNLNAKLSGGYWLWLHIDT